VNTSSASRRDAGFTLPELLISIVITSLVVSVIAMTITVSFHTLPDVTERADSSVAVQGITTWLPPDVDSAQPGLFDVDPGSASGCAGTDPGANLLRLEWNETFAGVDTKYVAAYRFVLDGDVGRIVRVACQGTFSLGTGTEMSMSAQLSPTAPTVVLTDADGDGRNDQVRFQIETLSGDVVYIDAATKNPNETLPPNTTNPATTSTTGTNQAPVANPMSLTLNPDAAFTFTLDATDPDGDALTSRFGSVPAGWTATVSGLSVTLTPTGAAVGTYTLDFEVSDPSGAEDSATLTVAITTSTTTTSTTTLPPCVVSGVTATPGSVVLQNKNVGKLKTDVRVVATITGGYCIGLTLQYDTGAPNGQYVQNFGDAAPYDVVLLGHPHGTELWATGTKTLSVRDGAGNLLAQTTLVVTD
jgi:prepilin-type N-terminal cleavage/methylation domain-containing protein